LCFLIIVAYDPLDPNGNITIKWDIMSWTPDGYVVSTNFIATCFIFSKQIKIPIYIVRELFGSSLKKKIPYKVNRVNMISHYSKDL